MHHQIIKSAQFFQQQLYSRFHGIKSKIVDTGLLLSICHLLVWTILTKSQMR